MQLQRPWRARGVAALIIAAAAGIARAEDRAYVLSGHVTSVSNPSGPWTGMAVGDAFSLGLRASTTEPPTSQTPTSRTYTDVFAVRPTFAAAGPYRADYFWQVFPESYEFTIADDHPTPGPRDSFSGSITSSAGVVRFEFLTTGPGLPVQSGLSGLDWPDAAELDPAGWQTAHFEITGDFGSGPVVVSGDITAAVTLPAECAEIDFSQDGLIDFADYLFFVGYFSEGDLRGDLCGCGIVDFFSYLIFLDRYDRCGGR